MPKDQSVFIVGRVIHETIKAWALAGWPENFCDAKVRELLRGERATLGPMQPDQQRTYIQRAITGAGAAERVYSQLKFKEHGALVEQWFTLNLPQPAQRHQITGAADVYDPITKTLYDLKNYSGSNTGNYKQLLTYAFVFNLMGYQVERVNFIYPLRKNPVPIAREITQEDIDALQVEIFGMIDDVEARRFVPLQKEEQCCWWCEFKRTRHCNITGLANVHDFSGPSKAQARSGP